MTNLRREIIGKAKAVSANRTEWFMKEMSLSGRQKGKAIVESVAKYLFIICAIASIIAVFSITFYMIRKGTPALFEVGVKEILFGTVWEPANKTDPQYGILYIIKAFSGQSYYQVYYNGD